MEGILEELLKRFALSLVFLCKKPVADAGCFKILVALMTRLNVSVSMILGQCHLRGEGENYKKISIFLQLAVLLPCLSSMPQIIEKVLNDSQNDIHQFLLKIN